ncbi:MAG: prolipoprotein diacylglyceryl transferase [Chitinophagales bacterium]|nr:prolipoprotein diacylglyceryl transferase [Chitinophagales bacterium]
MNFIFLRAYATLPEFFNALFQTDAFPNIPFNTYGFFVAMGFMVAAITASIELKRKGELGLIQPIPTTELVGAKPKWNDFVFPSLLWFFIGMKFLGALLHDRSLLTQGQETVAYLFSSNGYPIYGFISAALACAFTYYKINKEALAEPKEIKTNIQPQELIGELVFVAALFGVVGASVFEIIQPNSDMTLLELFSNPMNFLSGLTIYGGLSFGILGVGIYAWYRKIKPFVLFDSLSPGFILAMAFGRMGCHFSGDGDWGIVSSNPPPAWLPKYFWSNTYAHNVISEGERIADCVGPYCYELAQGVFPTAIYEIIMFLILFLIMWALRKKVTHLPGFMFMLLFVVSGIERFPIEIIRVTDRFSSFFNLSQAQIISVGMIIVGAAGMIYLANRYKLRKV